MVSPSDDAQTASRLLQIAKELLTQQELQRANALLSSIVELYVGTPAAREATALLKKKK